MSHGSRDIGGTSTSTLICVTKKKGRGHDRERRLPVLATPVAEEPWRKPDPGQGERYPIDFRTSRDSRIKGWTQFDESNRMLDFCLLAQVLHDGHWWDTVKVDTCHDEVHAHYYYRTRTYEDREVIKPISCLNDVDSGYQLAEILVITCWGEHVARWRDGI